MSLAPLIVRKPEWEAAFGHLGIIILRNLVYLQVSAI